MPSKSLIGDLLRDDGPATQRAADDALANGSCFGSSPPSPLPATAREKPSLLIQPLRTETLRENLEPGDLTEQLAATLSRTQIASITLANPSRPLSRNAPQPRNACTQYCLLGRLMHQGERVRVIVRLVDVATDRHVWGDSELFRLMHQTLGIWIEPLAGGEWTLHPHRAHPWPPGLAAAAERHKTGILAELSRHVADLST